MQLAPRWPFRALALALEWGAGAQTSARGRTERKLHPRASEVVVRSWRALRLKIAVRRGKGVLRPCTWPDGCGGPLGAALSAVSAPLRRNLSGRPKHETERRFAPVRRTSRGKRRVRLRRHGSGGLEYEKVCRSELANTGGMPTGVPRISANFSFSHTKSNMRQWPSMLYRCPTICWGGCHSSTRS